MEKNIKQLHDALAIAINAADIYGYKKEARELWAKLFNKACQWCGAKQHLAEVYCGHPFCQTWDKKNPDCEHFERWLIDFEQRGKNITIEQFVKMYSGEWWEGGECPHCNWPVHSPLKNFTDAYVDLGITGDPELAKICEEYQDVVQALWGKINKHGFRYKEIPEN